MGSQNSKSLKYWANDEPGFITGLFYRYWHLILTFAQNFKNESDIYEHVHLLINIFNFKGDIWIATSNRHVTRHRADGIFWYLIVCFKVKTSCFHLTKAAIIGAICCFLLYHGTQNVQDSHTPFFWCINFILISYLYNKVPTIQFICWVTKHLCLMRMNSPQTKQNTPGLFKHFLLAGILELMNQHYSISLHTSAVW